MIPHAAGCDGRIAGASGRTAGSRSSFPARKILAALPGVRPDPPRAAWSRSASWGIMQASSPWWQRWTAVILVALVAAGFAIAFRGTLHRVGLALGGDGSVAVVANAPIWERIALPALGGMLVGLILLVAARVREGAGVGFVMEAIVLGRVRVPLTRSVLLAVGSWLAIASGASLGREGPLIQFGAAAGGAARRVFGLPNHHPRTAPATRRPAPPGERRGGE